MQMRFKYERLRWNHDCRRASYKYIKQKLPDRTLEHRKACTKISMHGVELRLSSMYTSIELKLSIELEGIDGHVLKSLKCHNISTLTPPYSQGFVQMHMR